MKRTVSTILATGIVGGVLSLGAAPAVAHEPGAKAQAGRSPYCLDQRTAMVNLRETLRFVKTGTRTTATGHYHDGYMEMRVVRDGKVSWIKGAKTSRKCGPGKGTVLAPKKGTVRIQAGVAWKARTATSIDLPQAALDHGNAPSHNPNLIDSAPILAQGHDWTR